MADTAKIAGTLTLSNGEPATFAVVYIESARKYCSSNEKGEYELSGVPYGKYYIEVKTIEAEPVKRLIEVNKPVVDLSFKLKANANFSLDEVVVWGKNEAHRLKEKGFAVNMIETGKLARQSIQTTELLDRTAGVRTRQSGGMGSKTEYNINGLSGHSVRIFIDGIPLRNYGASFSLSSIPPEQIERIEVYKGTVPAYLSEDALGGAIHIVLKKKLSRNNLSVSYSHGSFNTHQGSIDGGFRDKKSGFSVDASIYYNQTDNNYKVWGDDVFIVNSANQEIPVKAKRFHDGYESFGIRANAGFTDVKWADNLMFGFLYSDMNKDIQNGGTMKVVYGARRAGEEVKMGSLKYTKRNLAIRNLDLTSFISYTHGNTWLTDTVPYRYNWLGERESSKLPYTGEAGDATLNKDIENTIAGRTHLSYALHRRHRISVNYLYNHFTRDAKDPLLPEAEQQMTETRYLTKHILSFTSENDFFDERLKTSLFFKHYIQKARLADPEWVNGVLTSKKHKRSINHNGYGFTLSYSIRTDIRVQASYEKTLRMPENDELLGNVSHNINPTYTLSPEKGNNYNIGLMLGTFDIKRHQLRADLNFFVRDIQDMIRRGEPSSNDGNYGFENLGKVMSRGFDAEVGYNYHRRLFITQNVSVFNARFRLRTDKLGNPYAYYNKRIPNAPYFTANSHIEYVFADLFQKGSRLTLNYHFGYVHKFFRRWATIGRAGKAFVPTQNLHDMGVVYSFPTNKITISINAKNITDEQAYDNWALQKPGRAFFAKISYTIF